MHVLIDGLNMTSFMRKELDLLDQVCNDALLLHKLKTIAEQEIESNPESKGNSSNYYALSKNILEEILDKYPRRSMRTYKNKFETAYPFSERRGQPYKSWLKARKEVLAQIEATIPKKILYPQLYCEEEE